MIELFNKENESSLGSITEEQFKFLSKHLEEEGSLDEDYYLDGSTLDYLKEQGMDPELTQLLEKALGSAESLEIMYKK